MLIFDQLQKNDPQLRFLAQLVFVGVAILLAGLWWVQVVSYRDYQAHLQTQSFRTVRIPAIRGKIMDRNGIALADSQPNYSVSLYLEDLRKQFEKVYTNDAGNVKHDLAARAADAEKRLGRKLTPDERKNFSFNSTIKSNLTINAHLQVVNGIGSCHRLRQHGARFLRLQAGQWRHHDQPHHFGPVLSDRHYASVVACECDDKSTHQRRTHIVGVAFHLGGISQGPVFWNRLAVDRKTKRHSCHRRSGTAAESPRHGYLVLYGQANGGKT